MTRLKFITFFSLGFFLTAFFSSCNTGIESTRIVRMSKADQRLLTPTAEDLTGRQLSGRPLKNWNKGDRFIIADNKAALILKGVSTTSDIVGTPIYYDGLTSRRSPDGSQEIEIEFRTKTSDLYFYPTGKKDREKALELASDNLAMIIDPQIAARADSLLAGKTLWIMNSLWYDAEGNSVPSLKYVPVEVTEVLPGDIYFPMHVKIHHATIGDAIVWMSAGGGAEGTGRAGSRPFSSLFSYQDPRQAYPSISDDNWNLICKGEVAIGMTKDECRLALGSPQEVSSGHDWNSTMDIWQYSDGRFLIFRDGLLSESHH